MTWVLHQQAFGNILISDECQNEIRLIQNNQPTNDNKFSLHIDDAVLFRDLAWKLLGRYIANNTHLEAI